ncbi:MAG: VWA domain-containing protein [Acidobacteria bacterium]|nr:VWA domain-containing protein [Acidobacteriota bacterium]
MNRKKFIKGLLILLLAPLVVLALFAGYVFWTNSRPQTGRLQTRVDPQVVIPGGEAAFFITFTGEERQPSVPPTTVDIAFLIDVSSSMTRSLPAMADAAYKVAQELSTEKDRIRFALIRFDTQAEITTPWTEDPETLFDGLKQLRPFTGGNDTRAAFVKLDELLAKSRPAAKKVAVFYTDGLLEACNQYIFNSPCPSGPMTSREMIEKAAALRAEGVELFSIGLPGYGSAPLMLEITDSPAHVFDPVDAADLAVNFRLAARGMLGASGEGGQLSHLLDGRHFAAPLQGTSWGVDRSGTLNLSVGKLPNASTTYAHPLVPLSSGLWRVGVEPPRLTFAAQDGRLQNLRAARRPSLLVVGWMMLLYCLLPAALWTLFFLTQSTPSPAEPERLLPDILRPSPPTLLPTLPAISENRVAPVPTLFIGLGGIGRRSLQATRAELKQAHLGFHSQPYNFLWIDLDTKEATGVAPFEEWREYPIKELIAPSEIRRAQAYLPEPGAVPEHLKWFDAQRYRNVPREKLNLAEGTRGDRALARLSLFQWLAQEEEEEEEEEALLSVLENACRELAQLNSIDGTRQIVVFASPDGGIGSGWFLDVGRLLQRIARRQQEQREIEFMPEIMGVLSDAPERLNVENRKALELEFGAAALSGAFPQRTTYVPDRGLLDGVDKESPYHWVFTTSAYDDNSATAQSAELAAVLIERRPRTSLLKASDSLQPRQFISVQTRSVQVLPVQLYERIHYEVFLRTVGPDILLDLEPSVMGGFALKSISTETAARRLAAWAQAEPPGTPLQLLLAAASDSALAPGFIRIMQGSSPPTQEWFANTLSHSITLRLHGHGDADDSQWHRDWMPGEAIATLRLLSTRLGVTVLPEVQASGAPAHTLEIIGHVKKVAGEAADQLEAWVKEFCEVCEKFHQRHNEFSHVRDEIRRLSGRTYLEPLHEEEQVSRWIKEIFETWLGTPDTTSAIRERLFFAVVVEGNSVRVVLRSYVASAKEFDTAAEAIDTLDEQARVLARVAPAIRIGGALAKEPQDKRKQLADRIVDTTTAPREVLVVAPHAGDGDETRIIEEFCQLIPQPPSHGRRMDQRGDDQTAVRRLELTEHSFASGGERAQIPYITIAEQQGELLRVRAENKYKISVSILPPELRVALAHPAAFGSFARAYKAGHIVLREDTAGRSQWSYLDTGEFLTFGPEPTLAQTAANYVSYIGSPPQTFDLIGEGGKFTKLAQWRKKRGSTDDDTLTLIAIDVYED